MIDSWYAPFFTETGVQTIKQAVAILTGITLLIMLLLRQTPEAFRNRFSNSLKIILFYFGLTGLICWGNYFRFHYDSFTHDWEIYHYYTGAKYFNELGYTELYHCSALASQELGGPTLEGKIRNLETNIIEEASEASNKISSCKTRFSAERWEDFKSDIGFFKERLGDKKWLAALKDHGFNGTPVWLLAGSYIANNIEINDLTIHALPLLDILLLSLMWLSVFWAFGLQTTCIALVFWGTNFPAQFNWTGGAFLRQDWLLFTVAAIALLKKGRYFLSGASLSFAILLRIFPVFILLSLLLRTGQILFQEKNKQSSKKLLYFWNGCILSGLFLMALSCSVYSTKPWHDFAKNSRKHLSTALTNYMGLKTIVTFTEEGRVQMVRDTKAKDPYSEFKEKKADAFQNRKVFLYFLQGCCLIFFYLTIRKQKLWVAAALSCGLIPIFLELTCYYYSFMLVFAFLSEEDLLPAILLCFVAWLDYQIKNVIDFMDVKYTLMSIPYLLYILGTFWIYYRKKGLLTGTSTSTSTAASSSSAGTSTTATCTTTST